MRRTLTYPCKDCGLVVTRRRDSDQPLVCHECGKARAAKAHELQREQGRALRAALG